MKCFTAVFETGAWMSAIYSDQQWKEYIPKGTPEEQHHVLSWDGQGMLSFPMSGAVGSAHLVNVTHDIKFRKDQ